MAQQPACRFFEPSTDQIAEEGAVLSEAWPFDRTVSYPACRCPVLLDGAPVRACDMPDDHPTCPFYEPGSVTVVMTVPNTGLELRRARFIPAEGYYEVVDTSGETEITLHATDDAATAEKLLAESAGVDADTDVELVPVFHSPPRSSYFTHIVPAASQ